MVAEWEVVALGRLIEPDRGISYGIVQPGFPVPAGVPIVRVSDVRDGRITTTDPLRVTPVIEAAYSRTRLKGGELLLTLVGTVGETAIVPESLAGWNTARAVAVIPVRKEIGSYWVQIALRTPAVREIIHSRLNTTVQATLNLRDVAQLPIILPPRAEQGDRLHPRHAGRQDRSQPPHERHPGGDGPRPLQVVVRGLRPGARRRQRAATRACRARSPICSRMGSRSRRWGRCRGGGESEASMRLPAS